MNKQNVLVLSSYHIKEVFKEVNKPYNTEFNMYYYISSNNLSLVGTAYDPFTDYVLSINHFRTYLDMLLLHGTSTMDVPEEVAAFVKAVAIRQPVKKIQF